MRRRRPTETSTVDGRKSKVEGRRSREILEESMSVTKLKLFSAVSALACAAGALVLVTSHGAVKLATGATLLADSLSCDMSQYKSATGLTAAIDQNLLVVSWTGQGGTEL